MENNEVSFEERLALLIKDAKVPSEVSDHWETNRNHYNNIPTGAFSEAVEGGTDIAFPCARPRAEGLRSHVLNALFSGDRVLALNTDEVDEADRIEEIVDNFLREIELEETLRGSFGDAWCTNHQIIMIAPAPSDMGGEPRWRATSILPEDFLCASYSTNKIQNAELVGHVVRTTRSEVLARVESGEYSAEDRYEPMTSPESVDANPGEVSMIQDGYDKPVEIYELLVRTGDTVEAIVYDLTARQVLKRKPYSYSRRWYYSFGPQPTPNRGFWCIDTLGSSIQGPHIAFNFLSNLQLYGETMAAFPVTYHKGDTPEGGKSKTLKPNQWSTYVADVMVPNRPWNSAGVENALQRIERMADSVARINPTGFSQNPQGNQTAREISAVSAGMDQSVSDFLTWYSRPIIDIAVFACEVLGVEFNGTWEIVGKNPMSNPEVVLGVINGFIGMLNQLPPQQIQRVNFDALLESMVSVTKLPGGKQLLISDEQLNEQQMARGFDGFGGLQPQGMGDIGGGEDVPISGVPSNPFGMG